MEVPLLPTGDAQINATMEPSAQIQPVTPAASGEGVAKAGENIGRNAEQFGHELSLGLMYQMRQKQIDDAYALDAQFRQKLQDIGRPFLDRKGRDAIGITAGTPQATGPAQPGGKLALPQYTPDGTIKYEDSWQGQAEKEYARVRSGLSGNTLKYFDRSAQSAMTTWRERMIQHESEQHQVARDQIDSARHYAIMGTAAIAPNAQEFMQQMALGDEVVGNLARRKGVDMDNPEIANSHLQASHAAFVKAYLDENLDKNPKGAQEVLNAAKAGLSPDSTKGLQQTIDGKMMHVQAQGMFSVFNTDRKMQLPNGDINMSKVQEQIDAIPNMAQDKKDQLFRLVEEKNNAANRMLNESNKAGEQKMASELSDPKLWQQPDAEDRAKAIVLHYTPKMRNGEPMHDQRFLHMAMIDQLNSQVDPTTNANTYAQLHSDINDGRAGLGDVVNAMKSGNLSKKSALQLQKFIASDEPAAMKAKFAQLKDRLRETYPDIKMQNSMYHSITEQAHDGNIHDPTAFDDLVEKNMGKTPTGGTLFTFRQNKVYGELAVGLERQNKPLVDALGGPENAVALAQRIGGPNRLAADTPESRAVMALIQSKVKPGQITRETIDWALKKYPELSKSQ